MSEIRKKLFRLYLNSLFRVLEENMILYCVFRDYEKIEHEEKEKEIDLFVDAANIKDLKKILSKYNFFEIPSWGHEPHNFFVTYIMDFDIWLKLDVITSFLFNKPVNALCLEFSRTYLENRTRREIAFVTRIENKFLILLLKCIINDNGFYGDRKARLVEIFHEIDNDKVAIQRISQNLNRYLGSALPWEIITKTITEKKWDILLNTRKKIIRRLFWHKPCSTIVRYLRIRIMKWAGPFLYMLKHRGISVALLAPDGAGKSTLAQKLFEQRYLNPRLIYMGSNSSAANIKLRTTSLCNGLMRKNRDLIYKKLTFGAIHFFNQLLEQWYRLLIGQYHILRGRLVVFDRFVYDSYINPKVSGINKRIRRYLSEFTFVTPDLIFVLDAPGKILFSRKKEHSVETLEIKRLAYLDLKTRLPNLIVIDATQKLEVIKQEVISLLCTFYLNRNSEKF